MADPVQTLTFLAWVRERTSELVTAAAGGRSEARASVTLTARGAANDVIASETRTLSFQIAGPVDIAGLNPGAIVRRYPTPGTVDHESDRCPYIELADPSLPWRYTPAVTPAVASANLHPWLVLIVGREGSELTLADGRVTIETSIQGGAHTLGNPSAPFRFAHVQVDGAGHRVSRIACGRLLEAGIDYLAVVVPAYDESGARSWTGSEPVTIQAYDAWRFRTAVPAGSFEDLAERLHPGDAPATTGHAPLRYPRVDSAPELTVPGALVAVPPQGPVAEPPLPTAIANDLAALQLPARDPEGRPIVALPRYGDAWKTDAPENTTWGRRLNRDPRHRGVAGLGLEIGIRFQEELISDVVSHLGALQEARQRVRHAVMGVVASRSLWRRRVPADPTERLWLVGPSLSRVVTTAGTVAELATKDDRTLPRGTFSAAARRVLRSGPARTALTASPARPAAILNAANRLPPSPPSRTDGLPLSATALSEFDQARRRTIEAGHADRAALLAAATDLVAGSDDRVKPIAGQLVTAMRQAVQAGRAVPWASALPALAASDAQVVARTRNPLATANALSQDVTNLRNRFTERSDDADLTTLIADLGSAQPNDPAVSPVDIGSLATGITAAFDPTVDRPPVVVRVLDTIAGGIDPEQPLAPPEPCVGLDRAAWADVARAFEDWLLPGVGQLPINSVVSLETNPVFTDAFLAGLNTQLLTELRWRNIPVSTGCTPIRRFWDRADTATGTRVDDVNGLHSWTEQSDLGDSTHRAPGAAGKELVIVVRGDLFLRYPTTLVYLVSAVHGTAATADFDSDPPADAVRVLPGFQGRIADDVAFFGFPGVPGTAVSSHWVVFEEPPAGYRFANDVATSAVAGHAWAAETLAQPARVLIRGDALIVRGA